ncbi:stage II sporulation protein P [Sporosarcina aquimarina]|uniref:Stage II sporulation protein P n=1 Tax=Sporosarcina aquimarina TaxID=114975 RepID=A0ABU4G2C0_9BACL|nr:stage II sporulation protein P [Sporosarcina aquimarina]MDW0111117.1 stage II sporulation protein P [Sporosarcina aquimarina]
MKRNTTDKHKKKSWLLILLFIALGLFICWLIMLLFWSYFFSASSEDTIRWEKPIRKIAEMAPESIQNWDMLNLEDEESEESSDSRKTERAEVMLSDGRGLTPTMNELLADHPFDKEKFNARFQSMRRPVVPPKDLPHSTFGKKVAYVYHSHSRESFLPYFPETDDPKDAVHESRNITQVGKMLERALENRGIGTLVDTSDIIQELDQKGLDFSASYQVTEEHIRTARSANKKLTLFLDIHRDSLRKNATTKTIQGQSFAQVFFVVGTSHESFKSNLAFTEEVNRRLDASYPGLSKGIFQKDSSQGNGVYNQDVSPTAVLIEVGGVDSTLEEMRRTTEVLADALSESYWHKEE